MATARPFSEFYYGVPKSAHFGPVFLHYIPVFLELYNSCEFYLKFTRSVLFIVEFGSGFLCLVRRFLFIFSKFCFCQGILLRTYIAVVTNLLLGLFYARSIKHQRLTTFGGRSYCKDVLGFMKLFVLLPRTC